MGDDAVRDDERPSLWRNGAFLRLWFAQLVSNAGTRITAFALPLAAVITLGATPAQMGLLALAGQLPDLLFSLFAGVWVDRTRQRPVLVAADIGRAVLLGSIPIAAVVGQLTFAHLCVVAFLAGVCSSFFQIASIAIMPSVVRGNQLVEANSKIAISDSVLAVAGPGVAGGLVQLLSAPKAMVVDAVSYVLSALSLWGVNAPEKRRQTATGASMWAEIGEGLREVVSQPLLRVLTLSSAVSVFGGTIRMTVATIFVVRELGLTPVTIGLIGSATSFAPLLGAVWARPITRRLGTGRAIIVFDILYALGLLIGACAGVGGVVIPILILGQIIAGASYPIYDVNQISFRQTIIPTSLLGRVTATRRFFIFGVGALGAGAGGVLGGTIGIRPSLIVGSLIVVAAALGLAFTPIRHLRDVTGATENIERGRA